MGFYIKSQYAISEETTYVLDVNQIKALKDVVSDMCTDIESEPYEPLQSLLDYLLDDDDDL